MTRVLLLIGSASEVSGQDPDCQSGTSPRTGLPLARSLQMRQAETDVGTSADLRASQVQCHGERWGCQRVPSPGGPLPLQSSKWPPHGDVGQMPS